jgi:hypothetical protein
VAGQDDDTNTGDGENSTGVSSEAGEVTTTQPVTGQTPADPPSPAAPAAPAEVTPKPQPPAQDEWKPPTKEEWEKVTGSLRDASGESAARKKRLRELEASLEELKKANATAEERAAMELEKRLLKEADDRWRPRVVTAEARSALAAAGCKDPVRWARLIDLGKVEIDGDGVITGVEEQVACVKADYPEAFKRDRPAPAAPAAAQPGQGQVPSKKRSPTERQAMALLGKT